MAYEDALKYLQPDAQYESGKFDPIVDYSNLKDAWQARDIDATNRLLKAEGISEQGALVGLGLNAADVAWAKGQGAQFAIGGTANENTGWNTLADSPGIVSSARGNSGASNTSSSSSGGIGTPSRWDVTPDQTVEGRINKLTDPNSPIIQQARFRANAAMNDRGLLNSSIAATAADSAAYEAAIPIAQADAATTAKAASYNADQQNQFTLEGSRQGSQMDIARLNADTQKQLSVMDNANREKAAAITASNNTLIQTNSQASSAFNQAVAAVSQIANNAQMDANAKTQATANVWASLISQLNVLGSVAGLNLTQTLNFANQPGFNAQGQYVGFNADGTTAGSAPPAPAPAAGGIVEAAQEQP